MSDVVIPTHGFHLEPLLLAKVVMASVAFGLASALFSEVVHFFQAVFKKVCPHAWLRPAMGGVLVVGLTCALGTREYLGIGIWPPNPHDATIHNLFHPDNIRYWAWWWKLLFTAVTLASCFKGGEVTPLFFIGAALGNALSSVLGAPTDLFAALGLVAIFAGASNTPLACTLMGIELFGAGQTVYIATACFLAYLSSGHSGIYLSQRLAVPKMGNGEHPPDASLRQIREMRPPALHDAIGGLVEKAREVNLAGATVLRGRMGFGANSTVHTEWILRLSTDLPIVIEMVDREEKVNEFLPRLRQLVGGGMITVEKVRAIRFQRTSGRT